MTVNYVRWLRSYVGHQRLLQLAVSAFIRDQHGHVLLGRRTDEGPYCHEHAQVSYQPAQAKKKTSAAELARSLRRYI